MRIAALVFDVDGTLADTEEAHRVAFNMAFERMHLGWQWNRTEYLRLLQVAGGKERLAAFIRSLQVPAAERRRLLGLVAAVHAEKTKFYCSVVQDGAVPLRDGVVRLLSEARSAGCRLAIASASATASVHALLRSALGPSGLELFSVIACGDEVPAKKPAPDVYELALQRLGVRHDQAVAFEDSTHGLLAADAAGLWTVVTPTMWTAAGHFDLAGLLLPRLGDPWRPLRGEPGALLHDRSWLTFDELATRLSSPAR
ncbi:MAG: HAD-IA family hydrolase [Pseudomonadota bacterium]|jgi:HAD superfamily hydrolase (TIGR01509 family)